jgi:hypothetical protein
MSHYSSQPMLLAYAAGIATYLLLPGDPTTRLVAGGAVVLGLHLMMKEDSGHYHYAPHFWRRHHHH